jgi:hypothetical protein
MAAITALQKKVIDDTGSQVVQEIRRQWNYFVENVAALDGSTATAAQIVTALQLSLKVVTTLELPVPPQPPTD